MRRSVLTLPVLALSAFGLSGCLGPEHDPHFLPYHIYPANSPGVFQYSTNLYRAPDAPPLWPGQAGAFP